MKKKWPHLLAAAFLSTAILVLFFRNTSLDECPAGIFIRHPAIGSPVCSLLSDRNPIPGGPLLDPVGEKNRIAATFPDHTGTEFLGRLASGTIGRAGLLFLFYEKRRGHPGGREFRASSWPFSMTPSRFFFCSPRPLSFFPEDGTVFTPSSGGLDSSCRYRFFLFFSPPSCFSGCKKRYGKSSGKKPTPSCLRSVITLPLTVATRKGRSSSS